MYISMVEMMRKDQLDVDVIDPDRYHLVSSVNLGDMNKIMYGEMNYVRE